MGGDRILQSLTTRLILTHAAVDDDRLSVVAALLNGVTVSCTLVGPRRASGRHANSDRLLVQANLETHTHVLFAVEHVHSFPRIFGNSVLYSCVPLRLASRRILLQLAFDNLTSFAKVTLEILGAGFVVDVADEDPTNLCLDGALTDIDMRSGR